MKSISFDARHVRARRGVVSSFLRSLARPEGHVTLDNVTFRAHRALEPSFAVPSLPPGEALRRPLLLLRSLRLIRRLVRAGVALSLDEAPHAGALQLIGRADGVHRAVGGRFDGSDDGHDAFATFERARKSTLLRDVVTSSHNDVLYSGANKAANKTKRPEQKKKTPQRFPGGK
jgi:hypothetical protein